MTKPEMCVLRRYYLTRGYAHLAQQIGRARCNAKPPSVRSNDSGYHDYSDDRTLPHIIGVSAEIAYARVTGKDLDTSIRACGDTIDFDGVEVKTSTWADADIQLKVKQSEYARKRPRSYLLCRGVKTIRWVEFIGSISGARFDAIKRPMRHKFVDNYVADAKDLTPVVVCFTGSTYYTLTIVDA